MTPASSWHPSDYYAARDRARRAYDSTNEQLSIDALGEVDVSRADCTAAAASASPSASSFTAFPPEARDGALDTTTTEGGANLPLETRAALQKGA